MSTKFLNHSSIVAASIFLSIALLGCSGSQQMTESKKAEKESVQQTKDEDQHKTPSEMDRPVANDITNEIPSAFFNATNNGTRTMSGKPGSDYWTQRAHYDIDTELIPEDTLLKGNGTITYYNNSPDTLNQLVMELTQNIHKQGSQRLSRQEITGGVNLHFITVEGDTLSQIQSRRASSGYNVNGTVLRLKPSEAVQPGESVQISIGWDFDIPQRGISGRMGYNKDNLFYIGYWYPQMSVYDDIIGWFTEPFLGSAEFYNEFGDYNIDITVPEQWMVASTGKLQNGKKVLQNDIYQRLQKGHNSDTVVSVVSEKDFGDVTKSTENGKVTWSFKANNVLDFAFSATKESMWDATRAEVGDRDGDGQEDYSNIDAIYRSSAPLWTNGAKYTRHVIEFLSDYTDLSYPWPHMSSVEGGGIIGGGMEYPMMTIIGAYKNQEKEALYSVIAHELSHMWVPMQVSSNERRYAWMDEGTTTFNENQAKQAYFSDISKADKKEMQSYLRITQTDLEGPMMRRSNFHYNGASYGIASYSKPATMLVTLRNLLGEKTFNEAYRTFLDRWQYKHPYPWDMFNTFEDVSGRELDWFWRAWYYETWTLDQAVGKVNTTENKTEIVIEDRGQAPMPAIVEITLEDDSTIRRTIPVKKWLKGMTETTITVQGTATKVVIDPDSDYPDANRKNNQWIK